MARGRWVKPQLCEDKILATISIQARYLFVCLWMFADDAGRILADTLVIKANIFPRDRGLTLEEVEAWFQELVKTERVVIYETDGERYGYIVHFKEHQKVKNPSRPMYPEPPLSPLYPIPTPALGKPYPNPHPSESESESETETESGRRRPERGRPALEAAPAPDKKARAIPKPPCGGASCLDPKCCDQGYENARQKGTA